MRASHSEGSVEGSPKSGKTRQIPVDGYVKPVLDFRARGRGMGEYLFTTVSGAQFSVRNARRDMGWSVVCAGHTWHDLRHTAAVEWAQMSSVLSTADIQRGCLVMLL